MVCTKKPLLVLIVESRGFFGSANNASCLDNAFVSLHPPRVLHFSALVTLWIGRWVGFAGETLPPFPCPTPLIMPISGTPPLINPGAMAPAAPHPFHWGGGGGGGGHTPHTSEPSMNAPLFSLQCSRLPLLLRSHGPWHTPR